MHFSVDKSAAEPITVLVATIHRTKISKPPKINWKRKKERKRWEGKQILCSNISRLTWFCKFPYTCLSR